MRRNGRRGIRMICSECKREIAAGLQVCPVCAAPTSLTHFATVELPTGLPADAIRWTPPSSTASPEVPAREGLAAIKSRRGLVIVSVVALGVLAALILAATWIAQSSSTQPPPTGARQLTEQQLRPGDCLTGSNLDLGSNSLPYTVTAVPCNQPHRAEIFFAGNLWIASLATYPGDLTVSSVGEEQCALVLPAYARDSAAMITYDWITPFGSSDWASGDREVVCVAYEQGVWLRNSLKVSRR